MSSTVPAKMTTFFPSPPHREGAALPQEHAQSAVESSMANARMATAIPTSLTGISIKKRRGFLKRRRVAGCRVPHPFRAFCGKGGIRLSILQETEIGNSKIHT